ncbi:class I SAM-dependent methyltransferase [Dyadobacter psychrophilus]|uniref:Methyltransferase domain-containing protein n=1 Tax=Dyadobacter psychrophilus TaxID=651661 RepID=A0A1T5E1G1_9BACT|nr:class I SAM-dependent methyltransferase [Dyadobacter psychrophilus]SKB77952.1 Methyltransferase domain-containing protein [Dyadobacter psychrophilus]
MKNLSDETFSGAVSPTIDPQKMEAFLGRVVTDFGAAFSAPLCYIGDKLGLYKAMAFAGPLTHEELAQKTQTDPRYVREWLINQAAGGYVDYNPQTKQYTLPDEHAVALTVEDSPFYVVGGFQIVNAMNKADERIIDGFRTGKGMLWGEHHHNLFQGTERFFKPSYIGNLLQNWLPAVEGAEKKLKAGARVADIGTGHGISTMIMAEAFPNSRFFGFDNHQPSIERANEIAKEQGLEQRTEFHVASAQEFPGENYDLITYFDCLHDMGDPVGSLQQAYKALAQDGMVMVIEPMAGRTTEENFNPVGRVYSGASVLCCTPNAIASGPYALGTVATDDALAEVASKAGFSSFTRVTETPFNRVFQGKK